MSFLRNLSEPRSPAAPENGSLSRTSLILLDVSYCFEAYGMLRERIVIDPRPQYETIQGQLRRHHLPELRVGQTFEREYSSRTGLCLNTGS